MTQRIRVIVADDHDCVRVGVMHLLQAAPHIEIVGEAPDTETLAELLDVHACDVVVSDIGMPGIHGANNAVSFLRRLLRGRPRPCVVVLTMICHVHMLSGLLHLGVAGIVDKRDTAAALIEAIEAAVGGRVYLSDQARIAMDACDARAARHRGGLQLLAWAIALVRARS